MATVDLLFSRTPVTGQPVSLVFGANEDAELGLVTGTLEGLLPPPELQGTLLIGPVTGAELYGVLPQPALQGLLDVRQIMVASMAGVLEQPALAGVINAEYLTDTSRPTVCEAQSSWQKAVRAVLPASGWWQLATRAHYWPSASWSLTLSLSAQASPHFSGAVPASSLNTVTYQDALRVQTPQISDQYAEAMRSMRPMLAASFQGADRVQTNLNRQRHQDALRDRRGTLDARWQVADGNQSISITAASGPAVWLITGWGADHQNAMRPPVGISDLPAGPGPDPCYISDPNLLFAQAWSADTNLIFICERHLPPVPVAHIVIPVLRTYVTVNSITLRRVSDGLSIPAFGFGMQLDWQSWTWSWSASIPADALVLVQPGISGDPIEVEAVINGVPYRLCAEGLDSQRQFAKGRIGVKGRGTAAILDAPYAPVLNFGNTEARTAQQLMLDALTINGVGIGWDVDWGLTDWLVPSNAWAHQGAYISAILDVAGAVGGYVQPHNTAQTLRVLPRYPAAPWDWSSITPDFELPAIATMEGINWQRKAAYNRIHVSGTGHGVLGQVTRAGTAGDSVAPMVTHSLITHADAARQRGLAELADTGRQAHISLKLPVLPETGLILPGKFVRYLNGSETHLGLVRSVSVDWSRPVLRQTISVETHA